MLLTPRSSFFNKKLSPTQLKASIMIDADCPGNLIAAFSCVGLLTLKSLFLNKNFKHNAVKSFLRRLNIAVQKNVIAAFSCVGKYIIILALSTITLFSTMAQQLPPDAFLYNKPQGERFHGEQVKALQRFLEYSGFTVGVDGIDGWFGNDTEKALINYQKAKGQTPLGKIKVKDIPPLPVWIPDVESNYLHGVFPGDPSPGDEKLTVKDSLDLVVKTKYGEIVIPFSLLKTWGIKELIYSPSARFLAGCGIHENDSKEFIGNAILVWDLISDQHYVMYAFEAFMNPEYQGLQQGYSFPFITTFWWTGDRLLFAEVSVKDGDSQKQGYLKLTTIP